VKVHITPDVATRAIAFLKARQDEDGGITGEVAKELLQDELRRTREENTALAFVLTNCTSDDIDQTWLDPVAFEVLEAALEEAATEDGTDVVELTEEDFE
jgi:hypothetical protein